MILPPFRVSGSASDRRYLTVCYHEAAHAVVATLVKCPVYKAFVMPSDRSTKVNPALITTLTRSIKGPLGGFSGMTILGYGDEPVDTAEETPIVPDEEKGCLRPLLTQYVAAPMWELMAGFTDKRQVGDGASGDLQAVAAIVPQLRTADYDLEILGRTPTPLPSRPGNIPPDATPLSYSYPTPFFTFQAFYFLVMPAVQKSIAQVADYLAKHQVIEGTAIRRVILKTLESEINRFPQWTAAELPVPCSQRLSQVLLIERLHEYFDLEERLEEMIEYDASLETGKSRKS